MRSHLRFEHLQTGRQWLTFGSHLTETNPQPWWQAQQIVRFLGLFSGFSLVWWGFSVFHPQVIHFRRIRTRRAQSHHLTASEAHGDPGGDSAGVRRGEALRLAHRHHRGRLRRSEKLPSRSRRSWPKFGMWGNPAWHFVYPELLVWTVFFGFGRERLAFVERKLGLHHSGLQTHPFRGTL